MIAFNVSDEGYKVITSTPLTSKGKPTKIDTKDRQPSVTAIDGGSGIGTATATVTVDPTGKLLTEVHHGTLPDGVDFEVTEFELSADADNDPGEDRAITEHIVVTTVRAEPSSLSSVVGDEIPD